MVCGACVLVLALVFSYSYATKQLSFRLHDGLDGQKVWVTGEITRLSKQHLSNPTFFTSELTRFTLKVIDFDSALPLNALAPKLIKVTAYYDVPAEVNQIWRFELTLKAPQEVANIGAFDYQQFALSQKNDALASLSVNAHAQLITHKRGVTLAHLRANTIERIDSMIKDLSHASLIKALIVGDRNEISAANKSLLQRLGVSHLLAISGMHIGIAVLLSSCIFRCLLWIRPSIMEVLPRVTVLVVTALPLTIFYGLISGFSITTQRALLMFIFINSIFFLRRRVLPLNVLFLLAGSLLLVNPLLILSIAFCLSFFATFVLIYYYNGIQLSSKDTIDALNFRQTISRYILLFFKGLILVQCLLFVSMPIVLSLFSGQIHLLSPFANIVAVPIVTLFTVPIGLTALLLSYINIDASRDLFIIMNNSLNFLMHFFNALDIWSSTHHFEYFQWSKHLTNLSFPQFILCLMSLLIVLSRPLMPGFVAAFVIIMVSLNSCNISMLTPSLQLMDDDINVTQFYVGQGLSTLIETNNYRLLYDTGPYRAGTSSVETVIYPYTTRQNMSYLDLVIISHADADHASGIAFINKHYKVGRWFLGGSSYKRFKDNQYGQLNTLSTAIKPCHSDQHWTVNNLTFSFLHPVKHTVSSQSENDTSCVLLMEINNNSQAATLWPGDISKKIEKKLLKTLGSTKVYLLSAPHHGSQTSSSKAFIETFNPEFALFSAGHLSRYKHPNEAVLQRYIDNGTVVIRSDKLGAVQFRYRNNEWHGPFCVKYTPRHFWQKTDNSKICHGRLN